MKTNITQVFQKYLTMASDVHPHITKYASKLNFYMPNVRAYYGKHTFKFAIAKIWEEIPTKMKSLGYFNLRKITNPFY